MQSRTGSNPNQGFLAAIALTLLGLCTNLRAESLAVDAVAQRLVPPVVAAHRSGKFVSGSPLRKVQSTLKSGAAKVLEMDLRLTHDGVVVVVHDPYLSGHGACSGPVEQFTFAELGACQHAIDGESVTRFDQILDVVNGRAVVNAEFKTQEVIAPAIRIVEAKHAKSWVYFQATGDFTKYRMARKIDPDIALLLKITSDDMLGQAIALHDPHLIILELDQDFVTPKRLARIHAAHMLVSENTFRYQFTEERFVASCDRVFGLGIDIAVTNNPSSCATQRGTWRNNLSGRRHSNPFDRPHLRADFDDNKYALELFVAGLITLAIALSVLGKRWLARKARARRKSA